MNEIRGYYDQVTLSSDNIVVGSSYSILDSVDDDFSLDNMVVDKLIDSVVDDCIGRKKKHNCFRY